MKGRVFLVQWDRAAAQECTRQLEVDGWQVAVESEDGGRAYQRIRAELPDVVVVDLSRKPSHGREVARSLRQVRATRDLPIVFVGGGVEARADIGAAMPDARFAGWSGLDAVLAELIVEA